MRLARGNRFWAVAAAWLLVATASYAAEGVPEAAAERRLVSWVGNDVGICLQLDDLAQRLADFVESPLAQRLHRFQPIATWRDLHRARLSVLRGEIERRTGANVRDLVKQLFGREVLFAIWPPSDPAGGQPAALLLAESTDRTVMQRTLERLVAARRQAGRWRGKRTIEVAGEAFTIDSVIADDDRSAFFVTSADDVAMIATSEALLVSALGRRADAGATDPSRAVQDSVSLASSPAYLAASERLSPRAVATLFVNPRAWDTALEADLKTKKPGSEEARSQAVLLAAWRETQYVAGSLSFAPHLGAELAWGWQADDLPDPVREVAASLEGRSELFDVVPADALIAVVAHADVGRLVRYMIAGEWQKSAAAPLGSATPSNRPDQNGSILMWALTAGLGPDWVGYLMPPGQTSSAGDTSSPVDLVLGVQTRPLESDGNRPALALSIEPLLHALSSAAVEAANRQAGAQVASIKSYESDATADVRRRITVASGIMPGRPTQDVAYCVDDKDRFWVSSSAPCLAQAAVEGGERLVDDAAIQAALGRDGKPSGLVYVNLAGWRRLAAKGRSAVDFLWQGRDLDERAKEQQFQELLALVRLADRLLFTSHVDGSTVHLAVTISADGSASGNGLRDRD
ncbi:MAG TPA: hypothetical protein VHC22_21005 [Pirellulales bacterium]|nr:hypothetical protein [Pirellulales bacterium]